MRERKNQVQRDCTGPEPTVPGTLRLYRNWNITSTFVYHYSTTNSQFVAAVIPEENWYHSLEGHTGEPWADELKKARCKAACSVLHNSEACDCQCPQEVVPNEKCTCGIYGFYTNNLMLDDKHIQRSIHYGPRVFGTVRASGRMLLGTRGARSQFAQLESIYGDNYKALRKMFPELPVYYNRERWLEDFPAESVRELIP